MQSGLDLSIFKLRRILTPEWAASSVVFAPELLEEDRTSLAQQREHILVSVEETLHWAFTDPEAIQKFQHEFYYADGVHGDYFVGRQYFGRGEASSVIIETECCLTSQDFKDRPFAHYRFIVTLNWDLTTASGRRVLARETERESVLATLQFQRLGTPSLADVLDPRSADDVDAAEYAACIERLEANWPSFLEFVESSARQAVEDGSSSGELDYEFFPSRLEMTGEYRIEDVRIRSVGEDVVELAAMLHFLRHPQMTDDQDRNYLGYELDIEMRGDHSFHLIIAQSSSI